MGNGGMDRGKPKVNYEGWEKESKYRGCGEGIQWLRNGGMKEKGRQEPWGEGMDKERGYVFWHQYLSKDLKLCIITCSVNKERTYSNPFICFFSKDLKDRKVANLPWQMTIENKADELFPYLVLCGNAVQC